MTAQLMPFNEAQFDRCALWVALKFGKPLTQYDLVKFHVMTDIYHVLDYGRPVIGGPFEKWKLGPVGPRAYHRLKYDIQNFEHGRPECLPLSIKAGCGNAYEFTARSDAVLDEEEFSQSEIKAMEGALKIVMLGFQKSQEFFHDPSKSFVGKAWASTADGCPIEWTVIVDAYDAEHGTDHSHIKTLIQLGV